MLRAYEMVYIFDTMLEEEQVEEKLDDYHEVVTGDGAGEVTDVDVWGRRKFAYPLHDKSNGYYVVAQFRADPEVLPELKRRCNLDNELMRHMIVLHEGEPTGPETVRTAVSAEPEEEAEGPEAAEDTAEAGDEAEEEEE